VSNLVLVIKDDGRQDGQLRSALTKTASQCQVEFATSRAEIPAASGDFEQIARGIAAYASLMPSPARPS
jgi:hypothetical protein